MRREEGGAAVLTGFLVEAAVGDVETRVETQTSIVRGREGGGKQAENGEI